MSQWDCDKCTFLNSVDDLTCTMCFQVRASTRALPFTWQWLAQVDWIPYDAPSNQQIEAAFKDGQEKVDLNRGWFASKRGEYTVHFGRRTAKAEKAARGAVAAARARRDADEDDDEDGSDAEEDGEEERAVGACGSSGGAGHAAPAAHASATLPAFTQVNNHSRMVRKVRRLADDDDAMFVVLPPSGVERGMKCGICAEEWWEMEDAATDAAAAGSPAAPSSSDDVSAPSASSASGTAADSAAAPASASSLPAASSSSSSSSSATCAQLYPDGAWPEASLACVKLAKCAPGHAFHRECVAQWIKLKDFCPSCKTKI